MEENKIKKPYPIEERNQMLIDFFQFHGFKNVKLIGDENQPKVILEDMKSVSGFVKNKKYHFTNKQFGGEVIHTVNLNYKEQEDSVKLNEIINSAERKKVYRLVLVNSPNLYYVKTTEKKTILWSTDDSRFYFDKTKALNTQKYLMEKYELETILI